LIGLEMLIRVKQWNQVIQDDSRGDGSIKFTNAGNRIITIALKQTCDQNNIG
jgi:hypothetical protein